MGRGFRTGIAAVALGALALAATGAGDGSSAPPVAPATAGSTARAAKGPSAYDAAVHIAGKIGSRPAGGRGERRAHAYVADQFEAAGLDVQVNPFRVPGRSRSQNVIGELDTAFNCLVVLMAHTDSVPPGHGANDNASGLGVLVALAHRLRKTGPGCDIWLVATGAEERVVIGTGYHVGSAHLVKTIVNRRKKDFWFGLSIDMVGRGKSFYLRSPHAVGRPVPEGKILSAARRAGVRMRWAPDSGSGNSDHREFELAGLPAAVMEVWRGIDPCHHEKCDRAGRLQPPALSRALRVAEAVVASTIEYRH